MKRAPKNWSSYELIDSGSGKKLERFGEFVLERPEPKAIWPRSLSDQEWEKMISARFQQKSASSGVWIKKKDFPNEWLIRLNLNKIDLAFQLKLTKFKHVGLFPEQISNWEYILKNVKKDDRFLNLFAYTGASSICAKKKGADVYHVDSIKQVINWGSNNMQINSLANIRWVLEDAMRFVEREVRRENKYDYIFLDPPSFGRGPKNERWALSEKINGLLGHCSEILKPTGKLVWNSYSLSMSKLSVETLLKLYFEQRNIVCEELFLQDRFGKKLPMGVVGKIQ